MSKALKSVEHITKKKLLIPLWHLVRRTLYQEPDSPLGTPVSPTHGLRVHFFATSQEILIIILQNACK